MRTPAMLLWTACLAGPAIAAGMSQARMEDDCLQRLRPIMPREARVKSTGFSALGIQANYYVVRHHFTQALAHGQAVAVCTYRRDGQWVSDDAAKYKLAQDLDAAVTRR